MAEIRFLEQKDLKDIVIRYFGQVINEPILERGFVATFDDNREPYCELIVSDGKKRYKVQAKTKYVRGENLEQALAIPSSQAKIYRYSSHCLFRPVEAVIINQKLINAYNKDVLNAESFLEYARLMNTSKQELISGIAQNYDNTSSGRGFTFAGLGIGFWLYAVSSYTEFNLDRYLSPVEIVALTGWIGGIMGFSLPIVLVHNEVRRRKNQIRGQLTKVVGTIESKLGIP